MGHSTLLYQVSSYTAKLWILTGHKRAGGIHVWPWPFFKSS